MIVEKSGQRVLKLIDMDFSVLSDIQPPPFVQEAETGERSSRKKEITRYIGTNYYFSPEHIKGEEVNESSDAFTAGLILYEILTGVHPYRSFENYDQAVINYQAAPPNFSLLHPGQEGPFFKNKKQRFSNPRVTIWIYNGFQSKNFIRL